MSGLTTTQLAERLNLTKGRISQLVKAGDLDGCYHGEGRNRRFDLAKAAEKLKRNLDPGQMLGNGAKTKKQIEAVLTGEASDQRASTGARVLDHGDVSRYELARIQNAEEDLRRKRRESAAAEGTMVLVSEVQQQIGRIVSQEIAEFEAVMREAAIVLADLYGLEARAVRQVLLNEWRNHREARRDALKEEAQNTDLSEAEKAADI
jgi:hypothetical protein